MLRIVHISDLHIRDASIDNDHLSVFQSGVRAVLARNNIAIHAGGHDPQKLVWLRSCIEKLRPQVLVVTGDLTNFGDKKSFAVAGDYLHKLREAAQVQHVICVPGNHDCLVERAAAIDGYGSKLRKYFVRSVAWANREVEVMREAAKAQARAAGDEALTPLLLENYAAMCREYEFGSCLPTAPITVKAGFGPVSFFAFNSVNGGGLMANKGEIGEAQFASFQGYCDSGAWVEHTSAIRIALLHHHPISSPQSNDGTAERAYDWMDDGPRLLKTLNMKEFHFVLHGHQHEPFTCAVDYGQKSQRQTLIVAAGSATQGKLPNRYNSFNVIDLLNPFEARVQRFALTPDGFETEPAAQRIYPLRDLDEVRLSNSAGALTDHDLALRALIRNSFKDFTSSGDHFAYAELEFDVIVTPEQLYCARYRRKGRLVEEAGAEGPIFVITGSPAMSLADMALRAVDLTAADKPVDLAGPQVLVDEPKRKEIRVRPRQALQPGEEFDLALLFNWQASSSERNDFDAVSLMGLREPVQLLRYRIELPWRAAQLRLQSVGNAMAQLHGIEPTQEDLGGGRWRYTYEIEKPPPVAYVFSFDL